ncbi:hypothetical protein ACLB2K_016715 [Fragaria x ananassa]
MAIIQHSPLDLAPTPDLKHANVKAKEFVANLHQIHITTKQRIEEANAKYKQAADVKRRHVEFEVGDFVWVVLTKDRFLVGEYNKLAARKVGPVEILEKINPNAYHLRLPSHICTANVFNVKHLTSYRGDNTEDDVLN